MPDPLDFFPSLTVYALCALVMACGQFIYAAIGFGSGIFSVALLAMILPGLARPVAILFLLTLATELTTLPRIWRHGNVRLLAGLLPTTAVGLWLGTEILLRVDASALKLSLGGVVFLAGAWFLLQEIFGSRPRIPPPPPDGGASRRRSGLSLPIGLVAGVLGGTFGASGPAVVIFLKTHRLEKQVFRATLIWFFFLMGFLRAGSYLRAGILTATEAQTALWLLPASLVGTVLGAKAHHRIPEWHFGVIVAGLLVLLGALLLLGFGK